MESDGLEDLNSEPEEVEEWDPESGDLDMKPKATTKKSIKRSKSKTSADSNLTNIKHRRTKSESAPRSISPRPQVAHVAEASTTAAKCSPLKSKTLFSGFRIPKKTQSVDSSGIPMKVDCSSWANNEIATTYTNSPSFNCYTSPKLEKSSPRDLFSKTRIQKPSPNSHIKSCPVTATQFCVSSSSSVTGSEPSEHLPKLTANPTRPTSVTDLHREQFTCITSLNNKSSPSSSGDERRSRKQKSPRKGLDSRDVSTNL
jgi:hypothetical protein